MKAVPVRNRDVREEELEQDKVRLIYQAAYRPWFASLARTLGGGDGTMEKKLELDELGTSVWRMVDGNTTVRDICRHFSREYGFHLREAELSVTAFLRELGKRGIIGLR